MAVLRHLFIALGSMLLLAVPSWAGTTRILNRRILPEQTLSEALHAAALKDSEVEAVIRALKGVFDFRKSRPGDQFRAVFRDGALAHFDYRQSVSDEWQASLGDEGWVASKSTIELEKQVVDVELNIQSSLYEAAIASGEDPGIAMTLSDVFAWDVDFYNDVRKGDLVRAIVERFTVKGRLVRYGDVLAARYKGEQVGDKRVYRYQLPDGEWSFFREDGSSARKTFLKSPLKYAHVTSKFGSRFHPVLKYLKAHNGVDYGAAIGTPVWAVADGTVTAAGYSGGNGNKVCIRHANGWETCYLHLSRYGAGVRTGAHVSQKQVIAYSGNTGLSTGPHLHFAMKRNGQFVNPLNQSFPRSEPLPARLKDDFAEKIAPFHARLEGPATAQAIQN